MTRRELIAELAESSSQYSRRDAEVMVNAVFNAIRDALCDGGRVEIRGFGSFAVRHRAPRQSVNPKTGAPMSVDARCVPFFKVGRELRERIEAGAKSSSDS